MRTINFAWLGLAMVLSTSIDAADSTSIAYNPGISLQIVSDGQECWTPGEIAQTVTGNYANCKNGIWQAQTISNPKYVIAPGTPVTGFAGAASFAECPANSKPYTGGCLVWPLTGGRFWHDEVSFAGGLYGFMPIPGETGVYCLYVADSGVSANIHAVALCGDK